MISRLERFLQQGAVKFALAFLIVLSVLPSQTLRQFDLVFFGIFALELAVRIAVLKRLHGWQRAGETAWVAIDAIAVLSFLPVLHLVFDMRYLRLLRLVRLSLLARHISSLAWDLWAIVRRHEIKHQVGFLLGSMLLLTLFAGIVLHTLQIPIDATPPGSPQATPTPWPLKDLLWWSFRSLESADNLAPTLEGHTVFLLFSLFLTLAGVFIMSLVIGLGTSVVHEMLTSNRASPLTTAGHLVVIGRGPNLPYLLREITGILRKRRRRMPLALLSDSPSTPPFLYDRDLNHVQYRGGNLSDYRALRLVHPEQAATMVILYDANKGTHADAHALSTVLALRQWSPAQIVLELMHRSNARAAAAAAGGAITPLPLGKILGGILSTSLVFPGMDRVFEELLTTAGNDINVAPLTPEERHRLAGDNTTLRFQLLLHAAYARFGVILVGLFVEENGREVLRLNPLQCDNGRIPPSTLTGLVGISREERDLDRLKAWVLDGCPDANPPDATPAGDTALTLHLHSAFKPLRQILVIGENECLPTVVEETSRFCPGVGFTILIQGRDRARLLARQLKQRWGCELEEDADDLLRSRAALKGERIVAVHGSEDDPLHSLTTDPRLAGSCFDAAVFLADNAAPDPDAQNLLWLFRLLELAEQGSITLGDHFHILAEILSSTKGDLVEKRAARTRTARVRALSTQKLRTYFMAHCCFAPTLHQVYDELVAPTGTAFYRVRVDGLSTPIRFAQLLDTLASQGMILVGFDEPSKTHTPPLVLNPAADGDHDLVHPQRTPNLYVLASPGLVS